MLLELTQRDLQLPRKRCLPCLRPQESDQLPTQCRMDDGFDWNLGILIGQLNRWHDVLKISTYRLYKLSVCNNQFFPIECLLQCIAVLICLCLRNMHPCMHVSNHLTKICLSTIKIDVYASKKTLLHLLIVSRPLHSFIQPFAQRNQASAAEYRQLIPDCNISFIA